MKSVKIGNIVIGESECRLVIPEMGINHEGSLETAKEMVDAAHRAGARIIKHQTHIVEDEMSGAAKKVIPGNADVSIYEIMNRCALSEEEEKRTYGLYAEPWNGIFKHTVFKSSGCKIREIRSGSV